MAKREELYFVEYANGTGIAESLALSAGVEKGLWEFAGRNEQNLFDKSLRLFVCVCLLGAL